MKDFWNFLTKLLIKLINSSSSEQKVLEEQIKAIDAILDNPREIPTAIMNSLIKQRQALVFQLVSRIKTDNLITIKSLVELSNRSPFNWKSIKAAFYELKRNKKGKIVRGFSLYQKASACIPAGGGLIFLIIAFVFFFYFGRLIDPSMNKFYFLKIQFGVFVFLATFGIWFISLSLPIFRAWQLQKYLPAK